MLQIQERFDLVNKNEHQNIFKAVSKKDGKQVVIRKISFANMNEKDKKNMTEEVNLLCSVKSNHIVKYYDYIIDKAQAHLYVIMQYCSGGSLEDYLVINRSNRTFLQEKAIWKIFAEVVQAVFQIHNDQQGAILHRDIKPKNIFLDKDDNVKLGNFSLLKRLNPEQQFALTYTSGDYYRSPQQIIQGIYSIQSDIWALGCLLFQMASLKAPFKRSTQYLSVQSIKQEKVQKIPGIYSDQLKRVINWCLQKQRQNRPTAAMLKSVPQINHRLRKLRLAQNCKTLEEKEQKLEKKQSLVRQLQQRVRQLENMHMKQINKENFQGQNIPKQGNFGYF